MSKEKTYEIGQQCLMKLEAATKGVETWKAYLLEYQPRVEYPDNAFVWLTCALALKGVATGNFGVGAILNQLQDLSEKGQDRCVVALALLSTCGPLSGAGL
jgi:hypothetical protein